MIQSAVNSLQWSVMFDRAAMMLPWCVLEEVDAVIFAQLDDRLLPVRSAAGSETIASCFALPRLRANLFNLNVEQSLDSLLHVQLGSIAVNLECVLVVSACPVNPFFGHERA